jgi:hypothetical protein
MMKLRGLDRRIERQPSPGWPRATGRHAKEGGNMLDDYRQFVEAKTHLAGEFGFAPIYENPHCHQFQNHLIEWALRQGRGATFADCGLGKTLMQLVWAENVYRKTNKPVLILAPLSVSSQTVEEAEKFGIEAYRSPDGKWPSGKGIITTNYERMHHFQPEDFSGVVCDESSILKNFDGAIKANITEFMRKVKYRAMYTATPSPNDYTELGTSSEALGDMAYMDMLQTFFKSNDDTLHPAHIGQAWRFKGHAEPHFWRWVASWARAIRRPSDLGFDDSGWVLPKSQRCPTEPLQVQPAARRQQQQRQQQQQQQRWWLSGGAWHGSG